MPLVQAYNREQTEIERFQREGARNVTAQLHLTRLRALFTPLFDLFELAGVLVVIAAGAWQMAQSTLTLGGLLAFTTYLTQLYAPVRGLSQLTTSVSAAAAGAERVIEALDQQPTVRDRPASRTLAAPRRALGFDAVSFRYPESREPALADVSFRVGPGETLAIVGESGAGKSTIVRLLLRYYDPTSGRVLIDGDDLRDVGVHALRDNIAVVLQESLVVSGTIRENIAYGRPGATDDEIEEAARADDDRHLAQLGDGPRGHRDHRARRRTHRRARHARDAARPRGRLCPPLPPAPSRYRVTCRAGQSGSGPGRLTGGANPSGSWESPVTITRLEEGSGPEVWLNGGTGKSCRTAADPVVTNVTDTRHGRTTSKRTGHVNRTNPTSGVHGADWWSNGAPWPGRQRVPKRGEAQEQGQEEHPPGVSAETTMTVVPPTRLLRHSRPRRLPRQRTGYPAAFPSPRRHPGAVTSSPRVVSSDAGPFPPRVA